MIRSEARYEVALLHGAWLTSKDAREALRDAGEVSSVVWTEPSFDEDDVFTKVITKKVVWVE